MTRNGQRSQVEMIWKSPDARGADESEVEKRKAPFAGLSVESTAVSAGDKIELSYDAIYNHQSGQPGLIFSGKFPEEIPADFDWSKLRSSQAKGRVALKSGETFMAPFTHVEPGKHLVVVFSVHEIDVTGRRLRTDGKFRIRSVIVTLPRGGRLPSYWFQIPAFPAEGQQEPPPSALLYPTRHLADIRKEAMAAGGETAWQDVGEAIAKDGEEASFGRDGRSKIRAAFWDGYGCRITMDLQNYERRFVASGYLGQISGTELEPTENGNRQVLLFALDEVK
ncbi:MAG: hypothetical protein EOP87_17110 [Verrucomicrobiaceae bacterium]|nr:MAG: hypothetical protein EOP87_17110 [Verrucomicrobiaceae bacterium]